VAILVIDQAPQGSETRQLLVGGILTVTPEKLAGWPPSGAVGVVHWVIRRPLLDISFDPEGARERGRAFRLWDFVFYASFGFVVTSSVRLAGVLLVFSYLIVPAAVGALLARGVVARLLIGWGFGLLVSTLGLVASWTWDLPTGAAIVTTFGALLATVALLWAFARWRRVKRRHPRCAVSAWRPPACSASWACCRRVPRHGPSVARRARDGAAGVPKLSSTPTSARHTRRVARPSTRGWGTGARAPAAQDAQWGTRPLSEEMQERVRQYIAGRTEMVTGDRLVLRALTARARARQRWFLGLPLAIGGLGAAAAGAGWWRSLRR
jgi:zinc/manganese transport system permease protein